MKKPNLPRKLTVENFKKYKSQMRKWDQWRIKNNISTPEEINKENSIFSPNPKINIIKFPKF